MGLAASRQLIDGHTTVFLPAPHGRRGRAVRGIARQLVPKLLPTANQAVKMGQISLNLGLEALVHGYNAQPFIAVANMQTYASKISKLT